MSEVKDCIENHAEQLREICTICKFSKFCKDKNKLCFAKRRVWKYAEKEYDRRVKEGKVE